MIKTTYETRQIISSTNFGSFEKKVKRCEVKNFHKILYQFCSRYMLAK